MWPFHLKLGPFAISPVEIFTVLGVALVALIIRKRTAAMGIPPGGLFDLALASLLGGAVGARLFYAVPLWIRGLQGAGAIFSGWSEGSGFFGGLVGGSMAGALACRLKRIPVLPLFDVVAVPLPLGFAAGKVGCFLAGCCYGRPVSGFPGVTFAPGSMAYREGRVLPLQLLELTLGVLLFLGLAWLSRRTRRAGEAYLGLVAGYSAWRFGVEFLRADPGRHAFGASGLSDSQISAVVLLAAAAGAWFLLRRRAAAEPPPAPK